MAFINYTSNQWGLRFAKESTFGTAIAVAGGTSGWITLPLEAMPKIEGDMSDDDLNLSSDVRIKDSATIYRNSINSTPTIPFSALWRREYGNYLVAGAMQTANATDSGADPYAHTFILHATQPDFSANAGFFYTACLKAAGTAHDELIKSCIISNLSIKGSPGSKGKSGLVTLDGTFWSPFARTVGNTFAATPSTPSTNFIPATKFSVTIAGGSALPVRSFSIDFGSNPFTIPTGGTAATIGFGVPFVAPKLKLELYYNADTVALTEDTTGTNRVLVLSNGVATSSYESFAATMNARITNDPLADSNGNGTLNCEFDLVSNGATAAISLITTDAIAAF